MTSNLCIPSDLIHTVHSFSQRLLNRGRDWLKYGSAETTNHLLWQFVWETGSHSIHNIQLMVWVSVWAPESRGVTLGIQHQSSLWAGSMNAKNKHIKLTVTKHHSLTCAPIDTSLQWERYTHKINLRFDDPMCTLWYAEKMMERRWKA